MVIQHVAVHQLHQIVSVLAEEFFLRVGWVLSEGMEVALVYWDVAAGIPCYCYHYYYCSANDDYYFDDYEEVLEAIVVQVQETSILSRGLSDLALELVAKAHLVHGQDDRNCELELVGVNWI